MKALLQSALCLLGKHKLKVFLLPIGLSEVATVQTFIRCVHCGREFRFNARSRSFDKKP